ncbi:MAG: potassium-transporting ATPase subunit KdpC [Pseudomonadota bacterium]
MQTLIRPMVVLFAALTVIVGIVYPLAVTGIGKIAFPAQVEGSLLVRDGKPVGSALIGQSFSGPGYFWGRPSATSPMANNGGGSSGSNQGPLNPALVAAVKARIDALKAADPSNVTPIPVDLVTASASGLDPEISVAAARYQAGRVAAIRNMTPDHVAQLVSAHITEPFLGLFGEARVNVLTLNLALDADKPSPR